ncbi:restriction endonuclease subunit S [Staphylococcus pseudintermedius]|uniref:restriction endonuclease subunit S n=1 Tax=Staphylococcus pseudintermedius TaxID=283734 RepID=UPI00397EEB28
MTDLKKNVPELRFPEFEGEWEEKPLNEKVEFYSGLTYSPDDITDEKGTFVVRSSNIKNNRLIDADKVYVNLKKLTIEKVKDGDIIVVVRNGSRKLIGKHALVSSTLNNTVIGAFMTGIRTDNSLFINALLDTETFKRNIHMNLGATINQITVGMFKKMKFYIPIDSEQQKIGDFFSKLDRQIELEEQKLVLLEEQKKGYMQKIFSQELRFKDDNGNDYPEWEEKKLSDLGSYSKSYSFSRDVEGEGKVHHIHYGDIHSKLPSKISDINLLPTIKESKDFEFLQKGDIIFADASEDYKDLGKAIMVDIDEDNIIAGLHTHVFRPNLQVVSEFLMYYTKTLNYFKFIKRQGTGISVLGISKKNLSNFILGLPEYKEQQKIGDFFSKLDQQIELQGQKIENLKQRKKGLLQKMFV